MSSERDVLEVLSRANPAPDPDAMTVESDASRYLAELINEGAPGGHSHKTSHPQRWIVPVVAAAAVAVLLLGLIAVSGGDADAPVTTTPPATTTTTHDGSDTSRDAAAVVTRFFDAYRTGDTDTVHSLLTEGVTITERYEGAQIYWGDTARFVSPIPTSIDNLATRIERGETLTEPTCQPGTPPISCTYSMQVVANGSAVSIPVRA